MVFMSGLALELHHLLISAVWRAGKQAVALIRLEDSGDEDNEGLVPRVVRHKKGGRHEAQQGWRPAGGHRLRVCVSR
jgi:hypothetical protein